MSETIADGVSERPFTLGDVPGVLWSPAGADPGGPLVLLAHGGGQHKKAPNVLGRASGEKTLHANPGRHGDMPMFEVDSSLRFFGRHLRPGGR
jgi:hypothetical protein